MKIRKIISAILTMSVMSACMIPIAKADGLYSEKFDMTKVKADKTDGVTKEVEVPDGDYTVTVTTGGKTETNANIYINGGERVRAYTLEAGKTQENEQHVVPKDGKITVQVKGDNPNVTEIDIEQLPTREKAEKPTIYIAGDSTAQTYNYTKVYPQTGWGQVFADYFNDDIIIENRAMGGRSSKSYDNDGRLDRILTEMHPGDYVFIQFGINDGAENKPESYEQFQQEIAASQMAVVLVSSRDDDTYWKKTGGHYVSISLYDASSDQVFLGDPADPDGNRSWIPLRYVYDALKTVSQYQYLLVQDYAEEQNQWMHDGITDAWGGM